MRQIVIIGGGIAGMALAAELAGNAEFGVTLVERGPRGRLIGSTGHAPGYVGLFNEAPVLTALARASADWYAELRIDGQAGFDRVGGLEMATTAADLAVVERRAAQAVADGLAARQVTPAEAAALAPAQIDPDRNSGGVFYPADGTARAGLVTAALQAQAEAAGARLLHDAGVTAIETDGRRVSAVRTATDRIAADIVVVACGIWGPAVAALAGWSLPVTPVAHPYVYGPLRPAGGGTAPFVRWPALHVYARDHGARSGIGSYDHAPVAVPVDKLGSGAELPWPSALFDLPIARALDLLPAAHRFTIDQRLNGVFSMTPDNLPLLGPVGAVDGLWMAEALWVTHAGGAARALAGWIRTGAAPALPGLAALRPDRFDGQPADLLQARALRLYRDIYAGQAVPAG